MQCLMLQPGYTKLQWIKQVHEVYTIQLSILLIHPFCRKICLHRLMAVNHLSLYLCFLLYGALRPNFFDGSLQGAVFLLCLFQQLFDSPLSVASRRPALKWSALKPASFSAVTAPTHSFYVWALKGGDCHDLPSIAHVQLTEFSLLKLKIFLIHDCPLESHRTGKRRRSGQSFLWRTSLYGSSWSQRDILSPRILSSLDSHCAPSTTQAPHMPETIFLMNHRIRNHSMFHQFQQLKLQGKCLFRAASFFTFCFLGLSQSVFCHCRSRPPIRISPYAWGRWLQCNTIQL